MQMGTERRETKFDIPADEFQGGVDRCREGGDLDSWIEEYVFQWIECQFGWGWSGGGFENDFSCMEGSEGVGLWVVSDSAVPNTIRARGSRA